MIICLELHNKPTFQLYVKPIRFLHLFQFIKQLINNFGFDLFQVSTETLSNLFNWDAYGAKKNEMSFRASAS